MRRTKVIIITTLILALTATALAPLAAAGTTDDSATADCSFPLEVTDGTGETLTLEEAPESVVALSPSDAQIMFEIGAEDRLVGMPDNEATEELAMGDRESVTDGYEVVDERVINLDPDLVLASSINDQEDVDQLRETGLDVYVYDLETSIDDVKENIAITGQLTDECTGAESAVTWMDDRIELLESATADNETPLVFYDMEDGITAGGDTFQHEILTTAGLENLGERADVVGWNPVNAETIVAEDPEWVIHPDYPDFEFSTGVSDTTAYEQDNILTVDQSPMSQPAPQVVFALEDIVSTVYPDGYEEIEADLEAVDEDHRETIAQSGDSDDEASDDTDVIPGFGIAAAAGVLALLTLVAARRQPSQ